MVMLLSLVCAALASSAAVLATLYAAIDNCHRLRSDKLLLRQGRDAGVAQWVQSQSVKVSLPLQFDVTSGGLTGLTGLNVRAAAMAKALPCTKVSKAGKF